MLQLWHLAEGDWFPVVAGLIVFVMVAEFVTEQVLRGR